MYNLTFLVCLPIFLISVAIFCYGLARLAGNGPQAGGIMAVGLSVGLLGIIVAAIMIGLG